MASYSLLFSCEHAGNIVPTEYHLLFTGYDELLNSHRGWDPGAKEMAQFLSEALQAPCYIHEVTRLLVETNRSLNSEQLFSSVTNKLSEVEKQKILDRYYFLYRTQVEEALQDSAKPVAHFSIHSFTPVLNGVTREVDIGVLFDDRRTEEKAYCEKLLHLLSQKLALEVKPNEPYKGTDDGFTTYLRKKFPGTQYLGIEIEVNQKFMNTPQQQQIQQALLSCIVEINSQ